jgi:hypothetical protein
LARDPPILCGYRAGHVMRRWQGSAAFMKIVGIS